MSTVPGGIHKFGTTMRSSLELSETFICIAAPQHGVGSTRDRATHTRQASEEAISAKKRMQALTETLFNSAGLPPAQQDTAAHALTMGTILTTLSGSAKVSEGVGRNPHQLQHQTHKSLEQSAQSHIPASALRGGLLQGQVFLKYCKTRPSMFPLKSPHQEKGHRLCQAF